MAAAEGRGMQGGGGPLRSPRRAPNPVGLRSIQGSLGPPAPPLPVEAGPRKDGPRQGGGWHWIVRRSLARLHLGCQGDGAFCEGPRGRRQGSLRKPGRSCEPVGGVEAGVGGCPAKDGSGLSPPPSRTRLQPVPSSSSAKWRLSACPRSALYRQRLASDWVATVVTSPRHPGSPLRRLIGRKLARRRVLMGLHNHQSHFCSSPPPRQALELPA